MFPPPIIRSAIPTMVNSPGSAGYRLDVVQEYGRLWVEPRHGNGMHSHLMGARQNSRIATRTASIRSFGGADVLGVVSGFHGC